MSLELDGEQKKIHGARSEERGVNFEIGGAVGPNFEIGGVWGLILKLEELWGESCGETGRVASLPMRGCRKIGISSHERVPEKRHLFP